ncbi:probable protein phosphatase 2C 78 [Zingiber officinale]|uniref:probable protein phosphatase 2C 78 n=1 Tax=Zingiber officinale TaxID=94328 RepID=UPI001C4AB7B1|nr:probable protein phosphatase 2C 78 [Zingiber officinale]
MLRSFVRPLDRCFGRIGGGDGLMWHMDLKPHSSGEFSIAVVQANSSLEDQGQVLTSPSATFVGVYDGHGGPEASRFVSNHLFLHLDRFASEQGGVSVEVIRKAFDATEKEFTHLVKRSWPLRPQMASVGSCCLVGAITGDTLFVANLGDSRAVLGCRAMNRKAVVAERLSTDHNVAVEEVRRELAELHPDDKHIVVHTRGVWRIKGIIQVSRSIGDVYLKIPGFSRDPLFQQFVAPLPLKRPVITAEPSIQIRKLTPHDLFLIFASDGLWEQLSDKAVVDLVSNNPRAGIAKRLIHAALNEAARKQEMRYDDIKKIEKDGRRHIHDDITVIVIYLDQNQQGSHPKFRGSHYDCTDTPADVYSSNSDELEEVVGGI